MSQVLIKNGAYAKHSVKNTTFKLVKPYKQGAKSNFITVDPEGIFGVEADKLRIRVNGPEDFEYLDGESMRPEVISFKTESTIESEEQIMERIRTRFDVLQQMTKATINGDIRAMIVTGPPGVGKSHGVEYELEKSGLFDKIAGRRIKYEVIKGAMTPIGLYCTLFRLSDPQNVLVFDDCDSVFQDDLSLNILKAALDSGKRRRIYWNSDSAMLRREGVPDQFDFKGSVIFITNLQFGNLKSKRLQDHLEALQSRCHFLDLTLNTMQDKFLRIKQIFRQGELFYQYDFTPEQGEEIIDFMDKNKDKLREMSLRMALKLADLTRISQENWKTLAISTCMKNSY